MTRHVFIRAGQNQRSFQAMSDTEARQAEKEGWGTVADDPRTDARTYSISDDPDHVEKADAYFNRQQGYLNREMTTAPHPEVRSLPVGEPDGGEDATVATPVTGGRASPPKGKKSARTAK